MKLYQSSITNTYALSSQNCKLRLYPEMLSGKEIFTNHLNHPMPLRQIWSSEAYVEKHVFAQIPKLQNSIYTMGIRIKGLTTKNAFDQYNLTS